MIRRGDLAITYLAESARKHDPAASSHWQKYHSEFTFDGKKFDGVHGFGGIGRSQNFFSSSVHRLLQRPFRSMGRRHADFAKLDTLAASITKIQNRTYNLDVLRQVISLSFLTGLAGQKFTSTSTTCVIGDGFASMTSLLIGGDFARKVLLVNLTKTLLVDLWYLQRWLGDEQFNAQVALVDCAEGLEEANSDPDIRIIAILASNHQLLQDCPLDSAINIASMQEMNPPVISAYFDDLRKAGSTRGEPVFFYCCNREEKHLPDGTITRIADYPWHADDVTEVDTLCPWHQTYYAFRPPFYHSYDGPVRHRLTKLSPAK